jgi:putative ABC transport system substrate-binding protein
MTSRRGFLVTTGSAVLALPLAAAAPSAKSARVAFLGAESAATSQHFLNAFREGLRERGYVEGRDLVLEQRWAEGRDERFPDLVAELIHLKVHVILAVSTPAAAAAKSATPTIPVVFIASDPSGSRLVSSLEHPGGNVTGVSLSLGLEFTGKWLELLRQTVPSITQVAILWNPANPSNAGYLDALETAARQLRVKLEPRPVQDPTQLDGAFTAIVSARSRALVVLPDPLTLRHRATIVDRAAKGHLPAMYPFREFVDAGGLMAYGANVAELCRRAAGYVDSILKGARPGDLPVEQPTKFQFIVNLKAAKVLGLTIPRSVLLRADQLIE